MNEYTLYGPKDGVGNYPHRAVFKKNGLNPALRYIEEIAETGNYILLVVITGSTIPTRARNVFVTGGQLKAEVAK